MATQLAHTAGIKALVIDCFADCDTQALATEMVQIPSLSLDVLKPAVEDLIARFAVTQVIYGSGFETSPASLEYLHRRLKLLGNSPDIFEKLADKPAFFALLDKLQIPYPVSQFSPPAKPGGWLVKPMQGQGGSGIAFYHSGYKPRKGDYYQKFIKGVAHSALFLADGRNLRVVGFNRQWTVALDADQAFAFAGVSTQATVSLRQQAQIYGWLTKLVQALSLKGLNSLDFIQDGADIFCLEINPRLSASVQLYAGDWLLHHLNALTGVLPTAHFKHPGYTAYQIIYAKEDVRIPNLFRWPENVCDMPPAGALIRKGQPICSIIAHQTNTGLLTQALQSLQHTILKGLYHHGILC